MFRIKTPAKINLTLNVLEKTAEGYHGIQTIFQQIPLFDELIFEEISEPKIIIQCDDPAIPVGSKNLIYQAAKILEPYRKSPYQNNGIKIMLKKNIPVAAGLGGGSSDAAATLKALNHLWKLKFSPQKLRRIGAKIGMDVPFFIEGGTAYGSHYGEKVRTLPPLKLPSFLLCIPGNIKKRSTARQYQKIAQHPHGRERLATKKLLKEVFLSAKNSASWPQAKLTLFHNDFDVLYGKKFASLSKNLYEQGAQSIHLAGSGPAFYAIFADRKKLRQASLKLAKVRHQKSTIFKVLS